MVLLRTLEKQQLIYTQQGKITLGWLLVEDMLPLRDACAVLFFVSVGMRFDPRILPQKNLTILSCLAIIIPGKSIAAFLLVKTFGYSHRIALTVSTSLAQIGEFTFILTGLAISMGLLSSEGCNLVLAGAILSIMLNPLLFKLLRRYLDKDLQHKVLDHLLQQIIDKS